VKPVLLTIGWFEVPGYGVLVALGIVAAVLVAAILAKRDGVETGFVIDAVFWMVVAGFAGGRATYLLVEWRETVRDPLGSLFNTGGGVYLGGFVTALAALAWFCRRKRVGFPAAADLFAPAVALGHAFGRIGCLLAGCCYGCVVSGTAGNIGIRYPRIVDATGATVGSWPFLDHLSKGLVAATDSVSARVYPVPVIEASLDLALFACLLALFPRRRFRGEVALAYVAAYSVIRFLVEFLRGDEARGIYAGFSTSQWLSLIGLTGAGAVWWKLRRTFRAVRNPSGSVEAR
jgi:phosphatidylglycerol:prolipoprotein diacylglycerol transferase